MATCVSKNLSTKLLTAVLLLATAVTGIISADYSVWVENDTSVCVSVGVTVPSVNGYIPKQFFEIPANETGEILIADVAILEPLQWQVACIIQGLYVRTGLPVPPECNITLAQESSQGGGFTVAIYVNNAFHGTLQSVVTQL